jgi:hypothetical protein
VATQEAWFGVGDRCVQNGFLLFVWFELWLLGDVNAGWIRARAGWVPVRRTYLLSTPNMNG